MTSEIELPDGTRLVIPRDPVAPSEPSELVMHVPPGAVTSPPHVHPGQTDEFEVRSGQLEVLMGDRWTRIGPGETVTVPPGVVHTYRNRSDGPVEVRNLHRPAESFDLYIRRLGWLVESGRLRGFRSPSALLWVALLWRDHRDTMVLARPPARVGVAVLSTVARLAGRRLPSRAQTSST